MCTLDDREVRVETVAQLHPRANAGGTRVEDRFSRSESS